MPGLEIQLSIILLQKSLIFQVLLPEKKRACWESNHPKKKFPSLVWLKRQNYKKKLIN